MAKKRKLTITQQIMQEVIKTQENREHNLTRNQYLRIAKRFVQYCRQEYNCRTYTECKSHIQDYANHLQESGYTASSIHTYIAACSSCWGCKMSDFEIPIRYTSEYTRGRCSETNPIKTNDINDVLDYSDMLRIQRAVGLRRSELMRLIGDDLMQDENGYWVIRSKLNKGGKRNQMNRINRDEDVEFIINYFAKFAPDEKIFKPELFNNKLNLHRLRAESAKEFYDIQINKIKENPEYIHQIEKEIIDRWNRYNLDPKTNKPKPLDPKKYTGYLYLRGKNKKLALENNLPTKYLKSALLLTSIVKLSHWRTDVAYASYVGAAYK